MADSGSPPSKARTFDFAWGLYRDSVQPHIEPLLKQGWNEAEEKRKFTTLWRDEDVHVITSEGKKIGWYSTLTKGPVLELENLFIVPEHRHKGIGRSIIRRLVNDAKGSHRSIRIGVLKGSDFHDSLIKIGFLKVGHDDTSTHMELKLQ